MQYVRSAWSVESDEYGEFGLCYVPVIHNLEVHGRQPVLPGSAACPALNFLFRERGVPAPWLVLRQRANFKFALSVVDTRFGIRNSLAKLSKLSI